MLNMHHITLLTFSLNFGLFITVKKNIWELIYLATQSLWRTTCHGLRKFEASTGGDTI